MIHPEPSKRQREKIKTGRGGGKETGAESRPGLRLPAFPQAGGRPLPLGGSPGGGAAARRGHGGWAGRCRPGGAAGRRPCGGCPGVSESPGTGGVRQGQRARLGSPHSRRLRKGARTGEAVPAVLGEKNIYM